MKPYTQYTAEELAVENLFIRWVKCPTDASLSAYWENWVKKFPEKQQTVTIARQLVQEASKEPDDSLANDEVKSLWERIKVSVESLPEIKPVDIELQAISIDYSYYKWFIAMLFVALLCVIYVCTHLLSDASFSLFQFPVPMSKTYHSAL